MKTKKAKIIIKFRLELLLPSSNWVIVPWQFCAAWVAAPRGAGILAGTALASVASVGAPIDARRCRYHVDHRLKVPACTSSPVRIAYSQRYVSKTMIESLCQNFRLQIKSAHQLYQIKRKSRLTPVICDIFPGSYALQLLTFRTHHHTYR